MYSYHHSFNHKEHTMNRVILLGHLFTDPYIKQPEHKSRFAFFLLLTEEHWIDAKGVQKEILNWHKVVVFRSKLVDWCDQNLKKGAKVIVEGQLYNRKQNNKSGEAFYTSEVIIGHGYGHITSLSPLPVNQEDAADAEDKIALQRASAQHASSTQQFSPVTLERC
jgi:single stranded DNA-binding protein